VLLAWCVCGEKREIESELERERERGGIRKVRGEEEGCEQERDLTKYHNGCHLFFKRLFCKCNLKKHLIVFKKYSLLLSGELGPIRKQPTHRNE
jgi:hypothetical protein